MELASPLVARHNAILPATMVLSLPRFHIRERGRRRRGSSRPADMGSGNEGRDGSSISHSPKIHEEIETKLDEIFAFNLDY